MRKSFLVVLAMAFVFVGATLAQASNFILQFDSDPGNWVGGGRSFSSQDIVGDINSSLYSNAYNSVHFRMNWRDETNHYHWWSLDLSAPNDELLEVGHYHDAWRWPFNLDDGAGLSFTGEGRGNNTSWGYFDILEVEYDQDNNPLVLAVDFAQYDTTTYAGQIPNFDEGLYGQLRYNSDIPLSTVPLPGAIWLLGSGFVGLMSMRKK